MAAFRRRVRDIRARFDDGELDPATVKLQDWRRSLDEGFFTEEELLKLDIHPGRKRKRARKQDKMHMDTAPHSTLSPPSSGSYGVPASGMSQSTSSQQSNAGSILLSGSDSEESCLSVLAPESDCDEQSLNTSLGSEELNGSESESNNVQMLSVLESKRIGVEALNQPLTQGSKKTKFEAMLMIFHLIMRHGLTDILLDDMIHFVNELVGDPSAIPTSKYLFRQLFMFGSKPTVHFFCPNCDTYLGPKDSFNHLVSCSQCDLANSVSSLNANNYFVTLSIRDQLREVLQRPHTRLISRNNGNVQFIGDMFHGKIYKKLMKDSGPLSNENALTISLSTDGSPVFKNGPNTLYPIHFHLNEISPETRFDVENMLLAGLWFSKKGDPNLQVFLKPVVDELLLLEIDGVIWRKSCGLLVKSPIYLTCVCADSVARCKIQNFVAFNSSYGCSYCMHPNISTRVTVPVKKREGIKAVTQVVRTAVSDDSESDEPEFECQTDLFREKQIKRYLTGMHYPLRTDRSIRRHFKLAAQSDFPHLYGAKGECVLSPIKSLNLVFGVAIDYLHNCLLGTMKRLAGLWFDQKSCGKPYYIGLKIDTVNKRLLQIVPPSNVAKPRTMSVRAFWKAKEWRSFLLYYGLPCLKNVLPTEYYLHFKKFSSAIYILTKEKIEYAEGEEAAKLLTHFVEENQELYGESNMVYNMHLLSHLGHQVAHMGPLWAYSLFPFEAGNGRLVKLVKGTMGVATQVAHKYLMTQTVSKLLRKGSYTVQDSVLEFCSKVVEYKYTKNSSQWRGVKLLGRPRMLPLTFEHSEALRLTCGFHLNAKYVRVYNRVIMDRVGYSSRALGFQKVSNDSCVRLQDGSFAMIDIIIAAGEDEVSDVFCVSRKLNVAVDGSFDVPPHVKECAIDPFGSVIAFRITDIKYRCMFISFDDKHYVSEFSNNLIERS